MLAEEYPDWERGGLPRLAERAAELSAGGDGTALRGVLRELALCAARLAAAEERFARDAGQWIHTVPAAAAAPPTVERTRNTVGGDGSVTSVEGSVVQAGSIAGDVHIHTPAPSGHRPARAVVPRQLLPVSSTFTGRSSELAFLENLMEDGGAAVRGPALVVVSGAPGIGKTALVSRWLTERADGFPDGQLYVDLRGHVEEDRPPAAPGEVLGQFLRALGATRVPAELAEQAALWRSLTAGSRLIVFLDNALSVAQVRPLLPGTADSLVAVTSRRRLTGLGVDGAAFLQLGALALEESVDLLTRRIGAERADRDPDATRAVAVACGGLPLAMCVAAARLAARPHHSLAGLAASLTGPGAGGVRALRVEGTHTVETALDESYRRLPPRLARGYRLLGLVPLVALDRAVAASALALPGDDAEHVLDELTEASMLENHGTGGEESARERFRFHDLTRAHAARRAMAHDSEEERRDTVRRVVDHCLWTATAAEALLAPAHRNLPRTYEFRPEEPAPFGDAAQALRWFAEESSNLMTALRVAAEQGWDDTAWQLADACWPLFLRLRSYDLWIEAHRVGRAAAERAGDPAAVSRMLTSGGTGLRNAGLFDEAVDWFTRAGELAATTGDRKAQAQSLHGLGQTHRLAGRLVRARAHFTRALALREEIGYRRGAALTGICLGDIELSTNHPEEAFHRLERARADLLAEHDGYDAARALAFLGRAAAMSGRGRALAERHLALALEEFAAAGSVHWQARTREMMGETAEEWQDAAAARDHYRRSLALYTPVSEADATRVAERLRRVECPGSP
ncbi:ATP-binding protein [Streptomyces sp. 8L]|uniref:ATP-binding protein n=1 Tax=Streptomyces sp. 8L TaxID=2877242 RepID=UPI001CD6332B|nr:tetratricopeptide repeat protein [Streptomyces sp. 8L]MCA1220599.1 tetratricopeptide repeat protein [Streptomyces sp. 8L]